MLSAQALYKGIVLSLLLLVSTPGKSISQTNTFSYLSWGDDNDEWKAAVVKLFKPGDSMPRVRFLHSRVEKGAEQSHYDDYINYLSDVGDKWRATIQYNPRTGTFYFTHCKNGGEECHDDVIMNYRDISGENRQLTIDNNSLERFKSKLKQINVHSKLLGRWDETRTDNAAEKDAVYISWKAGERCGCSSMGGGFKHYLYNATSKRYTVTVQAITNATPSHISSHDYVIEPEAEVYIGCSQSESQGCFSVDFAIINQVK